MTKDSLELLLNGDKLVLAMLDRPVSSMSPAQSALIQAIMTQVKPIESDVSLPEEVRAASKVYHEALFVVFSVSTLHQLGAIAKLHSIVDRMKERDGDGQDK